MMHNIMFVVFATDILGAFVWPRFWYWCLAMLLKKNKKAQKSMFEYSILQYRIIKNK